MPVTTRSASKKNLNTSLDTQPKINENQGNIRLRSGKVLSGQVMTHTNAPGQVMTQTNAPGQVMAQTNAPGQVMANRQRENEEIEKEVNKAIHVLNSYMVAFYETDHYVGCDHVMEKIRLVGMMFAYANSLSIPTMMNHRLEKVRSMMLKMCVKFSKEAKEQIDIRIKAAMEIMPERNPTRYYTAQLDDMQAQLDKFTKTYAPRL